MDNWQDRKKAGFVALQLYRNGLKSWEDCKQELYELGIIERLDLPSTCADDAMGTLDPTGETERTAFLRAYLHAFEALQAADA